MVQRDVRDLARIASLDTLPRLLLQKFRDGSGKHFKAGVVLYDGEAAVCFGEGLYAVPLSELWAT